MSEFKIGDIVTAFNKTGKYIGEVTAIRPEHYLVRALAVMKHPMQGDIHSPKDIDVPIFHERRAMAYREQANIPLKMVKPYEGEIPEYTSSLKEAVDKLKDELEKDGSPWALRCLENMNALEKDYFK